MTLSSCTGHMCPQYTIGPYLPVGAIMTKPLNGGKDVCRRNGDQREESVMVDLKRGKRVEGGELKEWKGKFRLCVFSHQGLLLEYRVLYQNYAVCLQVNSYAVGVILMTVGITQA